ncbi:MULTISPECIES: efflux transporter outer membrane subunit [unclassified Pseudomonas]|uniref:efflux transporter outer membrane subunit n=1 Tax=unclassified Pseudomonas TaxID=196821 RepID=UPI001294B848|nr:MULTISPECIES: efflux transporter outer membrane subunit [unclassified Pseudomonas]MQT42105.1 efflux transporter outer membrane subunit [Pseudomonas sp. FSL R10-0765]MQT54225.1 efflux transporter outer membrane subunit [Pseudomonas sp. FSL R10-2398]MQU01153.1 efflux transporter outer membrane subunit [Pseudomonas sp. FSL R10-2245]MQU11037.1 efflux transporter outer membrane subunit [Pseudomonas sp. FSL R10-2189]MQU37861.1 efflux transporter outer membrane subunit [Pseudomonas sp. FSL R10-217
MNSKIMTCAVTCYSLLSLGGCVMGPDFKTPETPLAAHWANTPSQSGHSGTAESPVDMRWWDSFGDAQLSALVREAQTHNFDLQMAASRLEQSRAMRRQVAADTLPAVDGSAGYSRSRNSQRGLNDPSGKEGKQAFNLWNGGLGISWEADLWGRVKRSVEVADASVQMAEEDRHAVQLLVIVQTAQDYIELRSTQQGLAVVEQNLHIAQRSLELTRLQLKEGVATDLEVSEAAAQVAEIQARLAPLQQHSAQLINALSLLLAREPRALQQQLSTPANVPSYTATVPIGLPSELAERRPDIRRAQAQLHAATAAIGVAEADFYPRITLSGNMGFQALQLSDLGSWGSRSFAFGPGLSVPLFEGGRLKGALQLQEGRQQEAGIGFQKTVLRAWHEVDDALVAYQANQRRRDSLLQAVAHNQRALDSVHQQYTQGTVDFLNVLTVQNALLANQAALVDSTAQVSLSLVDLYGALGGGWQG